MTSSLFVLGRAAAPFLAPDAPRAPAARPRFAHLYVENKCNLRCAHCYESEETHPSHLRLSLADYERVFDELAALGVLVVTFSGGEVFLRRDFLDLVALARKKRFAVRIYTSGTLLDERKADEVKRLKVSEVHISLYSHDAEVHDGFTGIPGSWRRSVEAMRLLRARGVNTTMKTSVMTINIDHLDELVALAQSLDVSLLLSPEVYACISGDEAPTAYRVPPEELATKLFARPELQDRLDPEAMQSDCGGTGRWTEGAGLCGVAQKLITVGADGNIYPCAMYPRAGGHLRDGSIEDIWFRSRLFDELRRTRFRDMTKCSSCDVKAHCSPCMAYGEIEEGDRRGCNSTSKNSATAVALVHERRRSAERKMGAGRQLPVV
ncbi:MAG: radical SAM protein, partial [Myxococcota bacterium]